MWCFFFFPIVKRDIKIFKQGFVFYNIDLFIQKVKYIYIDTNILHTTSRLYWYESPVLLIWNDIDCAWDGVLKDLNEEERKKQQKLLVNIIRLPKYLCN